MAGLDWVRIEELYEKALALDRSGWESFLDGACVGEPAVREQVERMLRGRLETELSRFDGLFRRVARGQDRAQWLEPGTRLRDRYEVRRRIASGGMGDVYRVHDHELGRDLAIKVIKAELHGNPSAERRFEQEARLTGQLEHPNVVPLHEAGRLPELDNRLYYVMRLVEGETLEAILARLSPLSPRFRSEADTLTPPPISGLPAADRTWNARREGNGGVAGRLDRLLSILEAVCAALAHAHSQGVIHRDLKPSNIMVGRFGEVQVMDWGLARMLPSHCPVPASPGPGWQSREGPVLPEDPTRFSETQLNEERARGAEAGRTRPGSVLGTPAYMAPEQARGETVDQRADVFALGAILCEMLTGAAPYLESVAGGLNPEAEERSRQRAYRGDVSPGLGRLTRCQADAELVGLARDCLAADPRQRPADAAEVAARLRRYREESQRWRRRLGRWLHGSVRGRAVSAAFLLALVAAALVLLLTGRDDSGATARLREAAAEACDRGLALCEEGDVDGGLRRLAQGLEYAVGAGDRDLAFAIRANLAAWERQVNRLLWGVDHPVGIESLAAGGGQTMLTAGSDGRARLCVGGGRQWHTFAALPGRITALAYHEPAGEVVFVGRENGAGVLYRRKAGVFQDIPLSGHDGSIKAAVFSPDGNLLLTGGLDENVRLWDAHTGMELSSQPAGAVKAVAFSGDGREALTGSQDGTVRRWSVQSGRLTLLSTLRHESDRPGGEAVFGVGFSARPGTVLTVCQDGKVSTWGEGGRRRPGAELKNEVRAGSFSPDGKRLLARHADGTARLWEVATGQPVGQPLRHRGDVIAVAASPDGKTILTAGQDRAVRCWRVAEGAGPARTLVHIGLLGGQRVILPVWAVAFAPDGKRVLTGVGIVGMGQGRCWDVDTARATDVVEHGNEVRAVAFSADGRWSVTGGKEGRAVIRERGAGGHRTEIDHDGGVWAVAFHPRDPLVLTGSWDGKARLRGFAGDGRSFDLPHGKDWRVGGVAFAAGGILALTAACDEDEQKGELRLWDTTTGKGRGQIALASGILCLALNTQRTIAAVGCSDGRVQLWRIGAARVGPLGVASKGKDRNAVRSLAFSPDGRLLVAGREDGSAQLWDVATARLLGRLAHGRRPILATAFAPGGQVVVTVSGSSAALWAVPAGKRIGPLLWHDSSEIRAAVFSPDGRRLLTGSTDGKARLWELCPPWRGAVALVKTRVERLVGPVSASADPP
jgi:WD40 repeat protein/serine/threonine protein kinase